MRPTGSRRPRWKSASSNHPLKEIPRPSGNGLGQLGKKGDVLRYLFSGLINLVEHAAIGEVGRLRLGPAAEIAVDGGERNVGELALILGQDFRIARTIEVPGFDLLRLGRIEEFHESFRGGPALVPVDILVDHRNR